MADTTGRVKEVFKFPAWVTILIASLSIIVGGAGWINSGLSARQDANSMENTQKIRQLENEDTKQNELIVNLVASVSDLKTGVAISVENGRRLDRIESLVMQILQRVK
jgi:hypothetical protein